MGRQKSATSHTTVAEATSVSWGWLEEPPTDGDIDNEYFPSWWGESDNNVPKGIYSFAQSFALILELTLEVRGTETLVNWTCGLWLYGPELTKSKIWSTAPVPDWGLVMALTSSSTAFSTSPVGSCVTTGVGELLSSSDAKFSGEKAVFTACVITAEMVDLIASTYTDTVPWDEGVWSNHFGLLSCSPLKISGRLLRTQSWPPGILVGANGWNGCGRFSLSC